MAYKCPRCGRPVQRKSSGSAGTARFGLAGALFGAALGSFHCSACGVIPKNEFPSDIRGKMALSSALLVIAAIAIIVLIIVLGIAVQR